MDEELRDSYRTLEKCLFHEGRVVIPSFIAKNDMLPFFQAIDYLPRVHRSRQMDEELRDSYRTLEKCLFHEGRVVIPSFIAENDMLPFFQAIDISRNPSTKKEKKIASPSVISSSSSSFDDNEAPSFLEFYDELSDSEDLTKAQREKRGMFKCLNRYVVSPNDSYVQTMDNWPSGPSNPSPPPRVSQPPFGFLNPPPRLEPFPSTQPLFVNIKNNTPLLHNNAPPLENIHHPPPNLGNQYFPNPPNILDFAHPNDMPHLHNMFCQCCSTTRHEIQMLQNCVNYMFSYIRHHIGTSSHPPYFLD
nr:hypothetical protein [Tanacetum cinerariifolium]